MARWNKGKEVYTKLMDNLAEYVSTNNQDVLDEDRIIAFGKAAVFDFINNLKVEELALIHEYFMYMSEMRPDPRFPGYHYSGGDRVIAVTRYIQKNIALELAKQYA